ncbi:MAG: glutamate racemase [Candidatus Marinimicrobia bacterium]|nr:glutamate racemase [Candidatus Neomarinimicrobiota bacterium]
MKKSEGMIGVFDSGLGGITVLAEIAHQLPQEDIIYFGDSVHAPYGNKSRQEVMEHSVKICDYFAENHCKAVVVACNTATSLTIRELRSKYKFPIIGMEPAVKPVSQHHKNILVMATPNTLKELKFLDLVKNLDIDDKMIKLAALELVDIVENRWEFREEAGNQILQYFTRIDLDKIGAIVLGCTHFSFFREIIEEMVNPDICVVDGNLGTARQLKFVLEKEGLIQKSDRPGTIIFQNSDAGKISLSEKLYIHQLSKLEGKK